MAGPLAPKLALARAVGAISRRGGRGGTSLPGKVLMRLDDDAIARLSARLPRGSVIVSATNGKTTTAAMLSRILGQAGVAVVHNRAGANMGGGIATSLLGAARPGGGMSGDLGLFEVDEFWLERMVAELHPRALLLGNLFRDQLDRYGELETIADRWAQMARAQAGQGMRLVLNGDDPLVADLGRPPGGAPPGGAPPVYFGVEDPSLGLAALAHAADAKHCRRCGAPYVFDVVYLGHLGHYHCPNCGQRRPDPQVFAHDVALHGVRSAAFTLHTPAGSARVNLPLPGLYNVYNAVAAAALAGTLDVALDAIVTGLESVRAAFGRAETLLLDGRELSILLVKNPTGANEVLRTLSLEPGQHDLLGVLNDNIADGRDVSWVWDADFEVLAERVRRVTCSGTRAAELALRLKYAGLPDERIAVEPDLGRALDRALADRPSQSPPPPLYALPTYTAMLALRDLLVERGQARSAWA
jgi:UDP-N-acetylmuramyl tripeptide synthase